MEVGGSRRRPAGAGAVNWIDGPYNRWAFLHVRELARTAAIRRDDGAPREFERAPHGVDDIGFEFGGRTWSVGEMIAGTYTDALVVLAQGRIVAEQYLDGMRPADPHLLMSVSKSLTAVLAGVLVGRGELATESTVPEHISRLRGTSWEGCTIQHLLDMRAGTHWDEDDYDDPDSHGRIVDEVSDYVPRTRDDLPPDTGAWIVELDNVREHGDRFQYRSILTDVLAWVIESTTGEPLAETFSRLLWSRIGAEYDAEIIVDNAGFPIADGGISCTARDLARFGQMLLDDGAVAGEPIVPAEWLARLRRHDPELVAAYAAYAERAVPSACYHDMWWIRDLEKGIYAGSGINGQTLRIDHSTNTVIVKFSTWPTRWDDHLAACTDAALTPLADAVSGL